MIIMVTEDYVSFEVAKMLKESDFRVYTKSFYKKNILHHNTCALGYYASSTTLPAPTLQMTMKWLREEHNICVYCYPSNLKEYGNWEAGACLIQENVSIIFNNNSHSFYANSYEEAVEAVIKYCLERHICFKTI